LLCCFRLQVNETGEVKTLASAVAAAQLRKRWKADGHMSSSEYKEAAAATQTLQVRRSIS